MIQFCPTRYLPVIVLYLLLSVPFVDGKAQDEIGAIEANCISTQNIDKPLFGAYFTKDSPSFASYGKEVDTRSSTVISTHVMGEPIAEKTTFVASSSAYRRRIYKSFTTFNTHGITRPIAFKTNLLYDLCAALNFEIEVPLALRWSIAAEVIFPWWLWEKEQHAMQILWGNIELRYWFRPNWDRQDGRLYHHNPLSGWFVGVYGGGGYYDLEWNKQGYQGEFYTAGLTVGYVLPLSRNLNMEFSLAGGYLRSGYLKVEARQDFDGDWHLIRQYPGVLSWIGPTKAKISLSWYPHIPIKRRGGRR